jgi:hypothetical protein
MEVIQTQAFAKVVKKLHRNQKGEPSMNCVSRINLPLNIKSIREVNIKLRDSQSPIM